MLEKYQSLCKKNAKEIVSKDSGEPREHRALNVDENEVRHYRIDGNVIDSQKKRKCDFLLLNDTKKKAYFIELKGKKLLEAFEQLEYTESLLKDELKQYQRNFRIVYRSNTHDIHSNRYTKFKARHQGLVKAQTDIMRENI